MLYVFGDYSLDPERYELRQAGRLVRVEPRVFDVLAYLVQHPGHTVTTEELLEQLYPNQFAPVDRLTNAVAQARKVLGETSQTPRYIQTIRRRGYRFIAPVEVRPQAKPNAQPLPVPDTQVQADEHSCDQGGAVPPPAPLPPAPLSIPSPAQAKASAPHAAEHDQSTAEWRQLTVLTCRLVSVAAPTVPLDPEVRLEVIRDYQEICTEVLHRFDGPMPQYRGTELEAHFGYPQAYEDAARRAVLAGLGIVEGMGELTRRLKRDWDVQLAVRVGIHTGLEVVAIPQHGDRGEPLVQGDTRIIATQLQDLAQPDTVLISQATFRLVDGYVVCEALGTHILEEIAEPLAVYQILRKSINQNRLDVAITKGLTPFVGREQEVGLLRERWEQATDGQGQVVVLSGEAGIGKSRLVQVLKEHLSGQVHTWIECRCSPYYQQSAFYPIVEHMQRRLQFHSDDTPEERLHKLEAALRQYGFALEQVIPLFAALLLIPLSTPYAPLPLTPEQQKQKTLEALLAWLLQEAERQPVCFIVEDLHWVDPSTLEWLALLLNQLPTARVLLLLVSRPDFRPPWAAHSYLTQVTLSRLSRYHVETMVQQITGSKALPTEVLQHLVATTDGVPLFVEELTKMVLESGLVKEREGQYELAGPLPSLAIPTTLHDSLMARLDRLGPAKQVAQLGATLGREFAYEVLQAVLPLEETTLQHRLSQLVEAELLYQRGLPPQARYRFKHALIQEAAYQSLLRGIRRQYHRQIAQVLEEQFPETRETRPELLAHHYTEASLKGKAVVYWQKAGQQALQRSAHPETISHVTKALALLSSFPDTPARIQHELEILMTLGPALMGSKGYTAPEVEQTYGRARILCQQMGGTLRLFPALRGLWIFYLVCGELHTTRELSEEILRVAQRFGDADLLPEAHRVLGTTLFYLGEFRAAWAHFEQGIALYDLQRHRTQAFLFGQDPGVTCRTYASWALWFLGYPDQALQMSNSALALAHELSHPFTLAHALVFAAGLHQYRREWQVVLERSEEVITLALHEGFTFWVAMGTIRRGWGLAEQGRVQEGITQIQQGIQAEQTTGAVISRPPNLAILAEVYGIGEQIIAGLHVLDEALTISQRIEEYYYDVELYRLKGALLLKKPEGLLTQGSHRQKEEAERCFHQALDIARRQQAKSLELRAAMSLSRLWQQQGKHTNARELLAPIYGWFTEGFDTSDLREARVLLEEWRG